MSKKWLSKVDKCDICKEDLNWVSNKQWFVDGKTKIDDHWAIMCPRCFEKYGTGLGIGWGQKYDVVTMERI